MMLLRTSFLFILILLTGAYNGYGQEKVLSSDYVILNTNDTLRGTISRDEGYNRTRHISFQFPGSRNIEVYSPKDIRGFSYNGTIFRSRQIDNQDLVNGIFLEEIVKGNTSLYRAEIESKNYTFFLTTPTDSLILLKKAVYLGLLKIYLKGCDQIRPGEKAPASQAIKYTTQSLQKLVIHYNQCTSPDSPLTLKPLTKIVVTKGLLAGPSSNFYQVRLQRPPMLNGKGYDKLGYTAGTFIGLHFNRPYSVQMELLYSITGGARESGDRQNGYFIITDFTYHTIRVPVFAQYTFSTRPFSPFIKFGPNLGKTIRTDINNESLYYGNPSTLSPEFKPNGISMGVTGCAGIKFTIADKYNIFSEARFNKLTHRKGVNTILSAKTFELFFGYGF